MHGSLSGKIKFRGYHRFRVNGSCYTFFLALKNGRIPFPKPLVEFVVAIWKNTPRVFPTCEFDVWKRFTFLHEIHLLEREEKRGCTGRVSFNGILIARILTGRPLTHARDDTCARSFTIQMQIASCFP